MTRESVPLFHDFQTGGESTVLHTVATVTRHEVERPGYYRLSLEAPGIVREAAPGQFLMVRCSSTCDPLLRRPISLFALYPDSGELELLYKVVGAGTRLLSEVRVGQRVDIMGPLGNGFTILPGVHTIAIVGRGVGVASLACLAQHARRHGIGVFAFVSARSAGSLLAVEHLGQIGCEVEISTDDGTAGYQGLATDLLRARVAAQGIGQVFVCGSRRLARAAADIAALNGIRGQVSLEERMACGLNACMGCVRLVGPPGQKTYKKVCKDGPVFWLDEALE